MAIELLPPKWRQSLIIIDELNHRSSGHKMFICPFEQMTKVHNAMRIENIRSCSAHSQ